MLLTACTDTMPNQTLTMSALRTYPIPGNGIGLFWITVLPSGSFSCRSNLMAFSSTARPGRDSGLAAYAPPHAAGVKLALYFQRGLALRWSRRPQGSDHSSLSHILRRLRFVVSTCWQVAQTDPQLRSRICLRDLPKPAMERQASLVIGSTGRKTGPQEEEAVAVPHWWRFIFVA
jgi:hypothetical protein